MKKLLFVIVLLLAGFDGYSQIGFGMGMRMPLGNGGNGANRSHSIEDQVQRMKKDLNLSDDQTVKLRGLLVERQRRNNGTNPMATNEFNERLEQILTPEQINKLKEKKQQKQQKQQQAPSNNGNNQPSPKLDNDDVYN